MEESNFENFSLEDMYHSAAKEPGIDDLTKDLANFMGAATAIQHSPTTLIYMAQDNITLKSPFLYDSIEVIEGSGEVTHVSVYVLSLYFRLNLPRNPELHLDSERRMKIFANSLKNRGYQATLEALITTGFIAVDNRLKEKFEKKFFANGGSPEADIIKKLEHSPEFTGKDFLNHFFTDMFQENGPSQ